MQLGKMDETPRKRMSSQESEGGDLLMVKDDVAQGRKKRRGD